MTTPNAALRRRRRERAGRLAERVAAAWLWLKGYKILALRARTHAGEIDLIALKGGVLVFVEVKSRRDLNSALNAVPPQAWRRIARAADLWTAPRAWLGQLDWRYDLIAAKGVWPICHLRDAWRPDGERP